MDAKFYLVQILCNFISMARRSVGRNCGSRRNRSANNSSGSQGSRNQVMRSGSSDDHNSQATVERTSSSTHQADLGPLVGQSHEKDDMDLELKLDHQSSDGQIQRRSPISREDVLLVEEEDNHNPSGVGVGVGGCLDITSSLVNDHLDARNRKKLVPLGNTFHNKTQVLKIIHDNIHAHFNGPWNSFSKVPPKSIKLWWDEFEKHFYWDPQDGPLIKANWKTKCSAHIRNSFCDARDGDYKPSYVRVDHWGLMWKHWKSCKKFKQSSQVNKRNRASKGRDGTANYTGGSKSVAEYEQEFLEENGREITTKELMKSTYHSERAGKWMGDRPEKCLGRFEELSIKWLESHSKMTKEDEEMLWIEAVGGEYKGRIFGRGSSYRKWDYVLNPPARDPSSADPESSPPTLIASLPKCIAPHPASAPSPTTTTPPHASEPSPTATTTTTTVTQSQLHELMVTMEARFQEQARTNAVLSHQVRVYQDKIQTMETERSQGSLIPPTMPYIQPDMPLTALLNSTLHFGGGGGHSNALG